MRLKSVRYPNARLVHSTYGSSGSDADNLNRLDAIKDDNGGSPGDTLAQYTWVGLGTMVVEDFQQPDVKLDYFGGTSGTYAGFDRFDRVVDQKWYDYGASAVRDQYTYGYDRASNRLYRENTGLSGKDEFYTYDGMNQLESAQRGDLTGSPPTGVTSKSFAQQWKTDQGAGLDPTGNWTHLWQDDNGDATWDLKQDRTHNKVNETTEITATSGTNWVDPVHDKAGNMTTVPKPSSPANGLTLTWDAWNRLVQVQDGQTVVGKYESDGLNRRVKKHVDSQSPASPNGIDRYEHFFYNSSWQTLETRDTTTETNPKASNPITNTSGRPGTSTRRCCGTRTATRTGCATTSGSIT